MPHENPVIHQPSQRAIAYRHRTFMGRILIGTSGFSYPHWGKGVSYLTFFNREIQAECLGLLVHNTATKIKALIKSEFAFY